MARPVAINCIRNTKEQAILQSFLDTVFLGRMKRILVHRGGRYQRLPFTAENDPERKD
jgi:hypothetical protein